MLVYTFPVFNLSTSLVHRHQTNLGNLDMRGSGRNPNDLIGNVFSDHCYDGTALAFKQHLVFRDMKPTRLETGINIVRCSFITSVSGEGEF
jgi:hypothetical protein